MNIENIKGFIENDINPRVINTFDILDDLIICKIENEIVENGKVILSKNDTKSGKKETIIY